MFFLYDMFQDSNGLYPTGNNTNFDTIRISNGIFDHLNLLNTINLATNEFDKNKPTEWTEKTVLNATFKGNIDAGSLGDIVGYIDHLELQRKEQDSDEWITLQRIYKTTNSNGMQTINPNFSMVDSYEKNNTIYTYQILPVDIFGNPGQALQQNILSIFNDAYIADASHIYKVTDEYSISNAQTNQISSIYTPYGSVYPFVAYNALTRYDSANLTAILLSPTSKSNTSSYIDRQAQVNLIKEFNEWLCNGKPKIFKDFNGQLKVVTIINPISNNYYKELGNAIATTTFSYVEVGDFAQEYLDKLGMTDKFELHYKNTNN